MSNLEVGPERTCGSCGARFSWNATHWLIADIHGRVSTSQHRRPKPEPEPEITRCPNCMAPLVAGKARVEEEK